MIGTLGRLDTKVYERVWQRIITYDYGIPYVWEAVWGSVRSPVEGLCDIPVFNRVEATARRQIQS